MSTLLDRAKQYRDGVEILIEWLGDGAQTVDIKLAQHRTDVCLRCPMNEPGMALVESVAKAIKAQVELRNHLGLRTKGIKSLHTCSACSCYLPLKIFVPIDRIKPEPEEEGKYWDWCWVLKEIKQPLHRHD